MKEYVKNKRVVNLRYMCEGLHFDAAVDCDWTLHLYNGYDMESRENLTPVELYCIDRTNWDIRMLYHHENDCCITNDQQKDFHGCICHTSVNFEEIIEETKKWIKEMTEG